VVIHRPAPARRAGVGRLATLFLVLVLASAIFFVFLFEMLASRISGGPNSNETEHAPAVKPGTKNN
jgi:hypothetical protein